MMNVLRIKMLIILGCVFLPVFAWATNYYVDGSLGSNCTSGNYSIANRTCTGTDGNAQQTIQGVIDTYILGAGDTVWIRGGTYTEFWVTQADQGSAGVYLIFKSYANENVIINATGSNGNAAAIAVVGNPATVANRVSYVKFDGRGNDSGMHITTHNVSVENGIVIRNGWYIWFSGLVVNADGREYGFRIRSINWGTDQGETDDASGAKYCLIEYCDASNANEEPIKLSGWAVNYNEVRFCNAHDQTNGTAPGINISGGGYEGDAPTGNLVHDNNVYNNPTIVYAETYQAGVGIGIVANTTGGPSGNKVYNNKIYNNGWQGIEIGTGATGNYIYGNQIYGNGYYAINNYGGSGNYIYNNLIYGNQITQSYAEIMVQNSGYAYLYNNSIKANVGNGIAISSGAASGSIVKNNIIWDQVGGSNAFTNSASGTTAQYNDFYGTTSYGSATQSNNINENPQWDSSYALTSSSPSGTGHVVDGGTSLSSVFTTDINGASRPQGSGWDMGAYEYGSGLIPPGNLRIIQ